MRIPKSLWAAPLALVPLLAPMVTLAQNTPVITVPETIVTATRIPAPAELVPAAVTVIDRAEIEERGYQTLSEALATVPGLRVVQSGGFGQQSSAFLRGTNARHVLVLLDGVPINDVSAPGGAFNFGQELLGDIERIEVVRGPGSALYGSGAIGGVINLVTRRAPQGVPVQVFGDLAGGTQGTARGTLGVAGSGAAYNYLLMAQGLTSQGSDATPRRFTRDTRETEDFRAAVGTARLGGQAGAVRLEGLLRWRENQTELDSVPNDDPNYTGDERRWFGNVRAETDLLDGAWTTGLRFAATQDRRRYLNLPHSGSTASTDDLFRGTRLVVDWGNRVRLGDVGPFTEVGLAFGATHEREEADSLSGDPFFRTRTDATAATNALHAGLQGRLFDRLDLSAGLRQDLPEDYGNFTAWRLGAVLLVPEVRSRVFGNTGTAFKAPSLEDRFANFGGFFQGNPNLRPESSFSYDLGVETDIPGLGRDDLATFTATWFDIRIDDLIQFDGATNTLQNVQSAKTRGVELGMVVRPADWLDARLAWTITEARDETNDRPLARRPRNVVAVSARIAPTDRLVLAPEVLFTGPSPEGAFASYNDNGTSRTQLTYNKSGTVLNLTGSYRLTPGITAYAEGRNLGNSRYEPANGFVVPGRSLLVGARFAF